ncbi:MAG: serine protease, partial [Hyphomonadaceae bacterium]|nr:serine protease [Hyphomonadaceae bacterium]
MQTVVKVLVALGLAMLASCDAVKMPGIGPEEDPDSASPTTTTPEDPDATTLEPITLQPIASLAEINAATCGLPEEAAPTLTIAQLNAPAGDTPRPEALLQSQVAGAAAIVSSLDLFPGIVKMEPIQFRENGDIASGHCGATRISENWFLTAAHCIDQGYDEIRFIAGTTNLRQTDSAQIFNADAAICHGGYRGQDTDMINDLALVHVSDETLPAIRTLPVASYGAPEEVFSQDNYAQPVMAGWGTTRYGALPSDQLLSAPLNLVSASPGVIVVESADGQGPCEGDSGGPLYVTEEDGQRRVVGVLSNVLSAQGEPPCSGLYRGRYTNVAGYVDWI